MLEEVHFRDEVPTPFEICNKCERNDGLLVISDRSVIFHNMSYDWVVATPNEKILAWSTGPCNGRGNSLQTEGVAMLSVTVFFTLIVAYTKNKPLMVTFFFQ